MAFLTHNIALVALWFCLLTAVTSSPLVEKSKTGKTFSMPIAHNADAPRHGPSDALLTMQKFNLTIPDHLQKAVDDHQTKTANKASQESGSTVPAASFGGDLMWLSEASVGTPPQKLNLDFDTGSSDTWVFSTDTKRAYVDGQTLYDPSKSSSSSLIDNCTWSIMYGDFSTSQGICYKDTFTLGDLAIPDMTIESAVQLSRMFSETKEMSGIVGLGWPKIKQTVPAQKCLLEFLGDVLESPVFTVDMVHNKTGTFNFGYVDDKLHQAPIAYTSVDNAKGFWMVQNTAFAIGDSDYAYSFTTTKKVIVDTGSTLMFAPDESVKTYMASVNGSQFSYEQGGWIIPCAVTPPQFLWEISDDNGDKVQGYVPGSYIIYAHATDDMCFAGLQPLGGAEDFDGIFGDIFLKSAFAVFDIGNKKFGAGPKVLNLSNDKRDLKGDVARAPQWPSQRVPIA
ncbi:secreted aspartic proteinase precursor [Xylariaceae sp. FL0016]|nr:secreted aspartic proteinase precursor [Xylariaceae sp. FL0016]